MSRYIEAPPPMNWFSASLELQQVAALSLSGEAGLNLYRTGQKVERVASMITKAQKFLEIVKRDLEVLRRNDPMWTLENGPRKYRLEEIPLLPQDPRKRKRLTARVEDSTQTIQQILAGEQVEEKDIRRSLRLVRELSTKYSFQALKASDNYKQLRKGYIPVS